MTHKLLVVTPSFHGYWRSIQRAFETLGYDVHVHCYDHGSKIEKIANKFRYEIPSLFTRQQRYLSTAQVSIRAIRALRDVKPARVLVIRGDVLEGTFWEEVTRAGVAPVSWFYDELHRMTYDLDLLKSVGPVASYSRKDVASLRERGFDAVHVPLAFDPQLQLGPGKPRADITFIGSRFPRRERFIGSLHEAGIPVHCFGRDWSNHIVDKLRTFRASNNPIPASRDLPLVAAWEVMRDSLATLNIHGDQDGFTMRTFEACGVGAVQLIDREDVEDYFVPGEEVLTFTSEEELLDHAGTIVANPHRFDELREKASRRACAEHTFVHRAKQLAALWR